MEKIRRTKVYIGIVLTVQAITFAVMFLALMISKKSFVKAVFSVATISGLCGMYLLLKDAKERREEELAAFMEEDWTEADDSYPEDMEIPVDDDVDEGEFR